MNIKAYKRAWSQVKHLNPVFEPVFGQNVAILFHEAVKHAQQFYTWDDYDFELVKTEDDIHLGGTECYNDGYYRCYFIEDRKNGLRAVIYKHAKNAPFKMLIEKC